MCVLFSASKEGGGRGGCGQPMGKLVLMPLTKFSDFTGKHGILNMHENSAFQRTNAAEFQLRIGRPDADVSLQLDSAKKPTN